MSEKINFKDKGDTDVKSAGIIDFSTLETVDHRDDDEKWNALEPFGDDDADEAEYKNLRKMSTRELQAVLKRAKASKIGQSILAVVSEAA